ncbi:transposase [Prevotella fusca]
MTYKDKTKKGEIRLISLLTNDSHMSAEDIIAIYKKRWQIETLFKQIKQNFPLRYFYGESANAIKIKIQIWITLIANLLITLVKNKIKRPWSFSGLATMIRILLMSYVSIQRFFEQPHKDWDRLITQVKAPPEELSLF